MRARSWVVLLVLLAGCDGGGSPAERPQVDPPVTSATPTPPAPPPSPAESASSPKSRPQDPARPVDFDAGQALAAMRYLAGEIGPRHGTSPAYQRAAAWVTGYFERLGYDVRRQPFGVPAGVSWGVPVPAGRSANVLAASRGFDLRRPHLVVGAHLDTVPQAPGAEDNASGVGVLLGLAAALAGRETRLPIVFVAFGAEEPRGPGDEEHHYGSRHYVAGLGASERTVLRGMVSLDRVGVGSVLPVCSASGPDPLRAELLSAARRARVSTLPCVGNWASDHWSFARSGLPGVRLGSTPYAAYHSAADVPAVVDQAQLERAGRTVLAWLDPR